MSTIQAVFTVATVSRKGFIIILDQQTEWPSGITLSHWPAPVGKADELSGSAAFACAGVGDGRLDWMPHKLTRYAVTFDQLKRIGFDM